MASTSEAEESGYDTFTMEVLEPIMATPFEIPQDPMKLKQVRQDTVMIKKDTIRRGLVLEQKVYEHRKDTAFFEEQEENLSKLDSLILKNKKK